MMEASNIDSGRTSGTILGMENNKNFIIIVMSKSFPANSAINNQIV